MRRPVLLAAALILGALPAAPALPCVAGDREEPPAGSRAGGDVGSGGLAERITKEQQTAIDRGLRWLASRQDPAGGFPTIPESGGGNPRSADYQTAVSALCTLAFLGAGHGLGPGEHQETVQRAVDWLLKAQGKAGDGSRPRGYISFPNDRQSKMHGHGFATLALAEAFATAGDTGEPGPGGGDRSPAALRLRDLSRRLRDGIQEAVDCIEAAQTLDGGWDYFPTSGGGTDHEGSITVCQVQALLAASNRGFRVKKDRIDLARSYMKRSQTPSGGFKYTLTQKDGGERQLTYALTAAGIVSILGLADWDRKEAIESGFTFLERKARREWRRSIPDPDGMPYYHYGSFYAVQAYHWLGGERWERFWVPMRSQILEAQNRNDGSWSGTDTQVHLGDAYPTAFSLLMLEVPIRYLSIYDK